MRDAAPPDALSALRRGVLFLRKASEQFMEVFRHAALDPEGAPYRLADQVVSVLLVLHDRHPLVDAPEQKPSMSVPA
jgi:hypothetical protein